MVLKLFGSPGLAETALYSGIVKTARGRAGAGSIHSLEKVKGHVNPDTVVDEDEPINILAELCTGEQGEVHEKFAKYMSTTDGEDPEIPGMCALGEQIRDLAIKNWCIMLAEENVHQAVLQDTAADMAVSNSLTDTRFIFSIFLCGIIW